MKYTNTNEKVAVIGLGYVGVPLLIRLSEVGFSVLGIDIDETRVEYLKNGTSYINNINDDAVRNLNASFETSFDKLSDVDVIVICVPTPLDSEDAPDLEPLKSAIQNILPFINVGQLICLESTTYPGCTSELLAKKVEARGYLIGEQVNISFSPEREDPGNSRYHTLNTPKLIGGITKKCATRANKFYEKFINDTHVVSSCEVAELAKLLENSFRLVNISLVNEIKLLADRLDINMHEVVNAAATKPFGYMPFYPSAGAGGHCIPVDPLYLGYESEKYGITQTLIAAAHKINQSAPSKLTDAIFSLCANYKKELSQFSVLIVGVAYKKNVRDIRNSAALEIIKILVDKNVIVSFYDPFVSEIKINSNLMYGLKTQDDLRESISDNDVVVIITDHDGIDYVSIKQKSKYVIDTKNVLRDD